MAEAQAERPSRKKSAQQNVDPKITWTCLLAAIGVITVHCVLITLDHPRTLELVPVAGLLLCAGGLIKMDFAPALLNLLKWVR